MVSRALLSVHLLLLLLPPFSEPRPPPQGSLRRQPACLPSQSARASDQRLSRSASRVLAQHRRGGGRVGRRVEGERERERARDPLLGFFSAAAARATREGQRRGTRDSPRAGLHLWRLARLVGRPPGRRSRLLARARVWLGTRRAAAAQRVSARPCRAEKASCVARTRNVAAVAAHLPLSPLARDRTGRAAPANPRNPAKTRAT
jgi:hypothetical protein